MGENTGLTTHGNVTTAKAVTTVAGQIMMIHFRSARMEKT